LSVSSGGGVGNVLQLLNDTYGIRGSGVQATNAKFDVIQAATANGLLDIVKNGTGGIRIGTTNNPSNTADLIIGRGNDSMELGGGIFTFQLSGGSLTADMVDKSFRLQNTATFIIYNATAAAGDIRFFAGPTRVIFGKQGDDVTVDSVPVCFDIPITNAATINAGETVKWDPAVPGRCITGGATALQPIGICVLGGVGNAPGGIKATIFYMGYKAILVSEAAIVQFRRIAPGATAGRWKDNGVAGIPALQHSIGVALDAPGGSGTNFKAWIDGCRLYV
jgi:hypothetical protein